jgi:diaminohydroxyphosphoribosylaminopyrimidine deaminase/5-amino-6-(5-phosphoribosylamino)uracil reductase
MPGSADDRRWLRAAIELSHRCSPVDTAYSVGAIVVGPDGHELARGYSRESDAVAHAEEAALAKLRGASLTGSTLYTSMEPCSVRRSRLVTCTQLILAAGLRRVVFALREPPRLADCEGAELLHAQGVEIVELLDLADQVRLINRPMPALAYGDSLPATG